MKHTKKSSVIFLSFTLKNSSVAEFFVELSNQLSRENKVIIITYAEEKTEFSISPDIKIIKWPSKRPTKVKDFIFLIRLIRKYKPTTMISNFGAVNMFISVGFLLNVKNRIAWYHTLSSQLEKRKFFQFRKKIIYKMATLVVANSKATEIDLLTTFGVPKNKIQVVYNGVKNPKLVSNPVSHKLVYAGRMDSVKGVDTLIHSLPYIIKEFPLIHITLIGDDLDGKQIRKYMGVIKHLKIGRFVTFTGNKSRQYVLKQFSSAYLTIVPSVVEAFGYVIIESFSVKTPVIGAKTSGIKEIVRDGKDGLLFTVNDASDLSEKILLLLRNPLLRQEFSTNCWNRFEKDFEVTEIVKNFTKRLKNDIG